VVLNPNSFFPEWIMSPNDAQFIFDEPVIERILIRWTACPVITTAEMGTDSINCAINIGLIVWKSDATVPNELVFADDPTKDWLWWEDVLLYKNVNDIFGFPTMPATGGPYQGRQDLRAKRKVPGGSGLAFCCQTSDLATHAVRLYCSGRVLWSHA